MDNQGTDSLIGGLAQGLNSYLGTQFQAQAQAGRDKQKEIEGEARDAAKQQAEQDRQMALEKQKSEDNADNSQFTPDMAEAAIPGTGAMISGFQKANGRLPTVDEGTKILKTHPQANGLGKDTDANTYAQLMKNSGVDDSENPFLGVKGPIPTGVATAITGHVLKGGLTDASIMSLYKEVNPAATGTEAKTLGEDYAKFATAMREPGKVPITNEQEFNTTAQKAEGYVQQQMKQYQSSGMDQGKAYSKALADAAKVASKYDRSSKAKLLFRIAANTKNQMAQPQQPAQTAPQAPAMPQMPTQPTMNRGIPQ